MSQEVTYPIHIVFPCQPLSTQHCYGQKGKIRYMLTKAKEMKMFYKLRIKNQYKGPIIEEELIMYCRIYFQDHRVRDHDNYGKLLNDSLTGSLIKDDRQIKIGINEIMCDPSNPRVELEFHQYGPNIVEIIKKL